MRRVVQFINDNGEIFHEWELPDNYCLGCAEVTSFKPSHNGSNRCLSGSIASGGTHAHCTCDTCF